MKHLTSVLTLYFSGLLAVLAVSFYLASGYSYQATLERAGYEAANVAEYINSELARFQNIPHLLSSNYQIRQVLTSEDQSISPDLSSQELSQRLMEIGKSAGADELFVMDPSGHVIAASNYATDTSFVGSNFAFRPYFSQAIKGTSASYYALGIRSRERGVFFATPVIVNNRIRGVIALKITVNHFEDNAALLTGDPDARLIGFGADRVIFMANQPQWQLRQLSPVEGLSWQEIHATRRYLQHPQHSLKQNIIHNFLGQPLWQLESEPGKSETYVVAKAELSQLGLRLAVLLPYERVAQAVKPSLLVTTASYLLLVPITVFIYRRLAGYRRLLYTRSALQQEVQQRTQELETAHQALIQSAKLATIGQLAASINHEINQPLSAISTYLVSSRRMLIRGKTEAAAENLKTIEDLIQRTHRIVSQLKQFSRTGCETMSPTPLQKSIDHALVIVGPTLKKQGITLYRDMTDVQVYADALRLEQVLVNLLSNAADAMQQSQDRQLFIEISASETTCTLQVRDTGPGLDLQKIDTIFEPFFTTKSNQGSGLGLAIARTIVDSFGGSLTAANPPQGGAAFTLTLKTSILKRDTD